MEAEGGKSWSRQTPSAQPRRRGLLLLVLLGLLLFVAATAFYIERCQWDTEWPVRSEDRTVTLAYCAALPPPLDPFCAWLYYDIEWFSYYKLGPGYADVDLYFLTKHRWVLEHYDQGIWASNSHTNGTLPFYLIFEDPAGFFPYGLTTELVKFTNGSRTSTEVVDEFVGAYDWCPHYYYWIGDNANGLCLHGDDLSYDLGRYGGKGTFRAGIAGTCGLACQGSDEVTLEWLVPPP